MRGTYDALEKKTLERLPGVVAAYLGKEQPRGAERQRLLSGLGKEIHLGEERGGPAAVLLSPSGLKEYRSFIRAGWVFVKADPNVEKRATTHSHIGGLPVAPVYLDQGGRVELGTRRVVVQLQPRLKLADAPQRLSRAGLRDIHPLLFATNLFEASLPPGVTVEDALVVLAGRVPELRFVEPQLLEVIPGRRRPNDPDYGAQWHHYNDGSGGKTLGADINSEQAWDLTLGRTRRRPIRVAVIDYGFQVNHPDLEPGIVGGGYFQANGPGWATFVPWSPGITTFPDDNHGTLCLGMAGARAGNRSGGCGSAPEADLLPIACLEDDVGSQLTLARAVAYAADPRTEEPGSTALGADVISCSLGPGGCQWRIRAVLDLALDFAANRGRQGRGIPIFWAVANANFCIAGDQVCSHPGVIAVGVTDSNDRRGDSAFGRNLAFLAPGLEVMTARSGSHFGVGTGTSMAAPLAAGVAALVLARHPHWTRHRVRRRMERTCDRIGGVRYVRGHNDYFGHGRINAGRAVR